jgi:hypothetical protein
MTWPAPFGRALLDAVVDRCPLPARASGASQSTGDGSKDESNGRDERKTGHGSDNKKNVS